jgi:hypothetical protein
MVRYIIDKDVKTLEELKGFDYEGYAYAETNLKMITNWFLPDKFYSFQNNIRWLLLRPFLF